MHYYEGVRFYYNLCPFLILKDCENAGLLHVSAEKTLTKC
jgi:hypothetical protein